MNKGLRLRAWNSDGNCYNVRAAVWHAGCIANLEIFTYLENGNLDLQIMPWWDKLEYSTDQGETWHEVQK